MGDKLTSDDFEDTLAKVVQSDRFKDNLAKQILRDDPIKDAIFTVVKQKFTNWFIGGALILLAMIFRAKLLEFLKEITS